MVAIRANEIGLRYALPRRLTLAGRQPTAQAAPSPFGGQIRGNGAARYIQALDGISFSLQAGDRLGLVGGNGAGKSTLIKVLFGIYPPTSGRVEVEGRVDALFNINLGFRREATGRRNIVLRGLINGWSRDDIEARMQEIIAFSELGEFIDMPFKTYSQGMAARLAFGMATSFEPEILLDEWIGAGDASFQDKARERMEQMTSKAGIIVIASHNKGLLKRTCNKILELEKGRLLSFTDADAYFDADRAPR
jgi:ABC-type polysaccharide/polyol phosphate transport system ATPase subunit